MAEAKYSGAERRRHERLNKQFVVSIQIQGASEAWDMVLIKNISRGGLSFVYPNELREGMILNLKINIAFNAHPVYCVGKVVRVRAGGNPKSYEAGILFSEIPDAAANLIERIVKKFLSENQNS